MKKVAGIVTPVPRGEYKPKEKYYRLNIVDNTDDSWLCKKECIGIEPSLENSEFWQPIGNSAHGKQYAEQSKESAELAKKYRDEAQAIVGVDTMQGATDTEDGKGGIVPTPYAGDNKKFLTGAGTYEEVNMEEKANGKGISFLVEDGIPFLIYKTQG